LLAAFTGDVVARLGLVSAWAMSMLALAAATATFTLASNSPLLLFGAAALFGAVYIALTGILLVWSTQTYRGTPALGVGAAFLMIAIGQAIGSPLLGTMSDVMSSQTAFMIAAAVAAAGAILVPRRSRKCASDTAIRTAVRQHGLTS
jgi:predicted MFS family arabinose efflux permease